MLGFLIFFGPWSNQYFNRRRQLGLEAEDFILFFKKNFKNKAKGQTNGHVKKTSAT